MGVFIYHCLAHANPLALLQKPKQESRRPIMDCGGKHPPFTLTFFQHLNVWEFIAGMLSCIMKGGKAAMSKGNNDNKFLNLPAKLFFYLFKHKLLHKGVGV